MKASSWRGLAPLAIAALLCLAAAAPSLAAEEPAAAAAAAEPAAAAAAAAAAAESDPEGAEASDEAEDAEEGGEAPAAAAAAAAAGGDGLAAALAPLGDATANGILAKLKEFPGLGERGAGLLQLAEEGLGIQASKLELKKLVPMLIDLQKNVHEHYILTKGSSKHKPSALLSRVAGRKSRSKVLKSMRYFAPQTEEGELLQQLDIVTQLLHELHTKPSSSMNEILESVSKAVGFELEEEEMKELTGQMKWAHDLMEKILPLFPKALKPGKAEEL